MHLDKFHVSKVFNISLKFPKASNNFTFLKNTKVEG